MRYKPVIRVTHGTGTTTSGGTGSYRETVCGGKYIYCDRNCANCSNAQFVYSTRNQTTNSMTHIVHIVKRSN